MNLSTKLRQLFAKLKAFQPIDESLVRTLYTLSEKSLLTAMIFTLLITFALYTELSYNILLWGMLLITLILVRLYDTYLFKTAPQMYSVETWYKRFILLSFSTGVLVSTLGFGFIHYTNDYYQLFILAALLGLTAGASISLSADVRIAIIYISIIILPLIISLAMVKTSLYIIIPILLILFLIMQIIMILKSYTQEQEIKALHLQKDLLDLSLEQQSEENKRLLVENKQFIADMVHQIKTPLSVIISNTSLIEMKSNLEFSTCTALIERKSNLEFSTNIAQINSAINMLSNSYEDLSYIISNDTIEYKPIKINLSNFLDERINFFDIIAQANDKTLLPTIERDIWLTINDTELERIIDNNLSNAIKHSNEKSDIEIVLTKSGDEIYLQFISKGKEIRDVSMIFNKDYTENHSAKRSLGLGLNMVKTICKKNHIKYSAHSEENTNTFTYIFKR